MHSTRTPSLSDTLLPTSGPALRADCSTDRLFEQEFLTLCHDCEGASLTIIPAASPPSPPLLPLPRHVFRFSPADFFFFLASQIKRDPCTEQKRGHFKAVLMDFSKRSSEKAKDSASDWWNLP